MTEEKFIEWWAYRHVSGTLHVKRYFDPRDIEEAIESPFVGHIFGPFECESHDAAVAIASKEV